MNKAPGKTLPEIFAEAAAIYGERIALIEPDGTPVTFRALQERVQGFSAAWAARGVAKGDRILLAMPIGADLYASLAAIWSLGATAVLPEPAMGLKGLRHALRSAPVQGLCASGAYRLLHLMLPGLWSARHLTPSKPREGEFKPLCKSDDIALISFTSGSTGAPKAIPRSHRFLMAQRNAVTPLLHSDDAEIDLVAFPVFVLLNLVAGRTSVLPDWRLSRADSVTSDALRDLIARHSATRLLLPPALCETLTETQIPSSVHTVFTGGGPVFPDVVAKLRQNAPALRIISVYGSTEAEPIAEIEASGISDGDRALMESGGGLLAGTPAAGLQIRIADGEIWVAGAHVVQGYLDPSRDAETKRIIDGVIWHRTGDAGRIDDEGRLWLLGRCKDTISTLSGTVYPFCIETAARFWPGVKRAALAKRGDQPVLVIEGDDQNMSEWRGRAKALSVDQVQSVVQIPMDRRHRSKVDQAELAKLL